MIDFRALPGSLATETRVHVPDPVSRRKFTHYWRVVSSVQRAHSHGPCSEPRSDASLHDPYSPRSLPFRHAPHLPHSLLCCLLAGRLLRPSSLPRPANSHPGWRPGEARHVRRRARRRAARRHGRGARRPVDAGVLRACRRRAPNRRGACARSRQAARADHPEEVFPHGRQLPRARGGVKASRLVARDRALDRLLPERRRDRRPRRADRLSGAPDRGARLRARARSRDLEVRQVVRPRRSSGLHRWVRDLQRHHSARHPASRDALRGVLVLQSDRHVLPARAVDRHA